MMSSDFEVLVTAEEAFPAFERAVLGAKSHIVAGFRIFDMTTRLRSSEAQQVGATWFDLLAHVLQKGVRFDLTVSDFDEDMAADLHAQAAQTVRQGQELAARTGVDTSQLRVRMHLHPARAGFLPRLFFAPAVRRKRLNTSGVAARRPALPPLHTVSHHQKLAVIDDELLYVGGLDLNERRYDTKDHTLPAHLSWSDVQVMVRGPAAKEAREHLERFTDVVSGRQKARGSKHILRTLSTPRAVQLPYVSPRSLVNEIETAHLDAFRDARKHLHIETQFLRSGRIAAGLAKAAATNPDLTATIILPGTPQDLAYEDNEGLDLRYGLARTKDAVETVKQAFGQRLLLATPVRPVMAARDSRGTLAGSPQIHVHNKVLVKDDDLLLIGSANLNGRSMRWDTEVAVATRDPQQIQSGVQKLLQHWWFDPLTPEARDHISAFDWWRSEIKANGAKLPQNRSGFLVPFDVDKNMELAQRLPGVTEDIV